MDTVTLLAIAAGACGGCAATWLVMTMGRLRERLDETRQSLIDQGQAQRDLAQRLVDLQADNAQLKADKQELQTRSWPANLNLDQRAWLSNVSTLQELAAQDTLDALMKLSPEAVQRVVRKIAPHLYERETIK